VMLVKQAASSENLNRNKWRKIGNETKDD
jgi:hypothetical protein